MCRCWNDEAAARPTFDLLVRWIDDIISGARGPAAAAAADDESRFYLNVARVYAASHCHAPHRRPDAPAPSPDTP